MVYEFSEFVLDGRRRELRIRGREVPVQPRVFDVLLYLVAHRDRVVAKEELLDAVWPDVVVSDGSLKRAVSLARSALREGGLEDAIRTYSRQGYRFDAADAVCTVEAADASPSMPSALERAWHAVESCCWGEAVEAFAEADATEPLGAADLERWASALQTSGCPYRAIAPLERAVAAHGAAGDRRGVARAALALSELHFERGELSVARGFLGRAQSQLPAEPVSREHARLAGLASRFSIAGGDYASAVEHAERAVELGRRLDDADSELIGMSYLGQALVARGDVHRGVAIHDEAAATALSGKASPLVGGLVYCGLIWTCRNRQDWQRAAEWTESFKRWCGQRSVGLYRGNCRLHRAEVLHHLGELVAAEQEVIEACELLAEIAPQAEADAFRVLGDLRLAQGDLDGAEQAFRRAHELGWDPQPGLAQLLVRRGRAEAALRALDRSLSEAAWANLQRRGLLLANLVTVALAAGHRTRAREALAELDANEELWSSTALRALVLEARAELGVHEGALSNAITHLREAVQAWCTVGAPLHAARLRLRLAELFIADGDGDAAELELSACRGPLERLGAAGLLADAGRIEARLRDES